MSILSLQWNNQIRATNAALAIAAYVKAKGEPEKADEDDIEHLIIDLLHLKALVSEEDPCTFAQYVSNCAGVSLRECRDEEWGELAYEQWPEGGREELRKWEEDVGPFSRAIIEEPPHDPNQNEAKTPREKISKEVLLDPCEQTKSASEEAIPQTYSVIAMYEHTGQVVCDHVEASSGQEALRVVAKDREDCSLIVAIAGEHSDIKDMTFAGDGVVDAASYLELDEDEDDSDEEFNCECGRPTHTCLVADGGSQHGDRN